MFDKIMIRLNKLTTSPNEYNIHRQHVNVQRIIVTFLPVKQDIFDVIVVFKISVYHCATLSHAFKQEKHYNIIIKYSYSPMLS